MAVTFNAPLPGPYVPPQQATVVTGHVDGDSPNCTVLGTIIQHAVLPAFAVGIDGSFQVTIAAGLLMDNNIYRLTVWSGDPATGGSIFLNTQHGV